MFRLHYFKSYSEKTWSNFSPLGEVLLSDSVHFPQVIRQYPFRGKGIYRLYGKVLEEFDCITIEVKSMHYLPVIKDPRYIDHNKKGTLFNKNTFKKL